MKKALFLFASLIILATAYYMYKVYTKPHTDVASSDVFELLSSKDIYAKFIADEEAANLKYAEQVITVKGLLLSKDLSNESEPQISLEGDDFEGVVRCGFKPAELEKVKALKEGSEVQLKGICIGLNGSDELDLLGGKDVLLSNCIIIE